MAIAELSRSDRLTVCIVMSITAPFALYLAGASGAPSAYVALPLLFATWILLTTLFSFGKLSNPEALCVFGGSVLSVGVLGLLIVIGMAVLDQIFDTYNLPLNLVKMIWSACVVIIASSFWMCFGALITASIPQLVTLAVIPLLFVVSVVQTACFMLFVTVAASPYDLLSYDNSLCTAFTTTFFCGPGLAISIYMHFRSKKIMDNQLASN